MIGIIYMCNKMTNKMRFSPRLLDNDGYAQAQAQAQVHVLYIHFDQQFELPFHRKEMRRCFASRLSYPSTGIFH